MTDMLRIGRLPLPDNWNPEGTRCIRVIIPDDAQYMDQIIGIIDLLKWSTAFARDDTETGAATVARTWRAALESLPITICEGDMTIDYRDKPTDPRIVQYSPDGGETWLDGWTKCAPTTIVQAPVIETNGDARAVSGGILEYFWKEVTRVVVVGVQDEDSDTDIKTAVCEFLQANGAGDCHETDAQGIIDHVRTLSEPELEEALTDCVFSDVHAELSGFIEANPKHWLDQWADWLFDHLNTWSDDLMNALNQLAYSVGIGPQINAFYAGGGVGGGGAGFGGDCEISALGHTFRIAGPFYSQAVKAGANTEIGQFDIDVAAGEKYAGFYAEWTLVPASSTSQNLSWTYTSGSPTVPIGRTFLIAASGTGHIGGGGQVLRAYFTPYYPTVTTAEEFWNELGFFPSNMLANIGNPASNNPLDGPSLWTVVPVASNTGNDGILISCRLWAAIETS